MNTKEFFIFKMDETRPNAFESDPDKLHKRKVRCVLIVVDAIEIQE